MMTTFRITFKKLLMLAVNSCWILYGKIHKGWRKKYAAFMRKHACNVQAWTREQVVLADRLKKTEPGMLKPYRLYPLKLKFFLFRTCCGALLKQDSLDQIHAPYRYLRRLVTNARTSFAGLTINSADADDLCKNKARSAGYWQSWFRRNWQEVSPEKPITPDELDRVLNGKNRIVVKPLDCLGGTGVEIVNVPERFSGPEQCAEYLNSLPEKRIVEEYVQQTGFLHDLNPSSVNTVRIATWRHASGEIEVLNAYLRVGKKGAAVDNLSSGGHFYVIDLPSGIMRPGTDERGQCLFVAGKKTDDKQLRIPGWTEAVEFCRSAHLHAQKDLIYVGWDVCISEDGLYMIEVNNYPGLSQAYTPRENPWKKMRKLLDETD